MHNADDFAERLLSWYDQHGRSDLPWRQAPTPYRVWLSEIMLQQTQVATVLPYFQRFIQRFPNLADLAQAPLDEVLALWAGLGYYSRARHLHRSAQIVQNQYGGVFPDDPAVLASLPGIGRSTAAAIVAIAFKRRAAILDGNVKRVLARWGGVEGWSGESAVTQALWALSERLTPSGRVDDYTQAIMDLGATLCRRSRPDCARCPVYADCVALRTDRTAHLPTPRPRKVVPVKTAFFLALRDRDGRIYLQRQPAPGLWGGLWSLPRYDDRAALINACLAWQIDPNTLQEWPARRHTFTHFHLDYTPVVADCLSPPLRIADDDAEVWAASAALPALPTPIQRFLAELLG